MPEKIKISQWIVNIIIVLLFASYTWIFQTVYARIDNVEAKFETLNPTLLKIQTDVSKIQTDIEWIKKQK